MADKIALTLHLNADQANFLADVIGVGYSGCDDPFVELVAEELRDAAKAQQTEWHGFVTGDATSGPPNHAVPEANATQTMIFGEDAEWIAQTSHRDEAQQTEQDRYDAAMRESEAEADKWR